MLFIKYSGANVVISQSGFNGAKVLYSLKDLVREFRDSNMIQSIIEDFSKYRKNTITYNLDTKCNVTPLTNGGDYLTDDIRS